MSTKTLFDFLTFQQADYIVGLYKDQHGPWPISVQFTEVKDGAFKRALYRHLHILSQVNYDHYDEEFFRDYSPAE